MLSVSSRIFAVSMLLVCLSVNAFADDGCYITTGVPEPRIYYVPTTGTTQPRRFFSSSQYYITTCPAGSSISARYATNVGSPVPPVSPNRCYANYVGQGDGLEHSGNYTLNGVPVSFTVANCPIDGYVSLLFFGMAGFGALAVRHKKAII